VKSLFLNTKLRFFLLNGCFKKLHQEVVYCQLGWHSWYSKSLWVGRSEDHLHGAVFSTLIQTSSGTTQPPVQRYRRLGGKLVKWLALTTHPRLAMRLKKEWSCIASVPGNRVNFTFLVVHHIIKLSVCWWGKFIYN
jgi:hypothetical protein